MTPARASNISAFDSSGDFPDLSDGGHNINPPIALRDSIEGPRYPINQFSEPFLSYLGNNRLPDNLPCDQQAQHGAPEAPDTAAQSQFYNAYELPASVDQARAIYEQPEFNKSYEGHRTGNSANSTNHTGYMGPHASTTHNTPEAGRDAQLAQFHTGIPQTGAHHSSGMVQPSSLAAQMAPVQYFGTNIPIDGNQGVSTAPQNWGQGSFAQPMAELEHPNFALNNWAQYVQPYASAMDQRKPNEPIDSQTLPQAVDNFKMAAGNQMSFAPGAPQGRSAVPNVNAQAVPHGWAQNPTTGPNSGSTFSVDGNLSNVGYLAINGPAIGQAGNNRYYGLDILTPNVGNAPSPGALNNNFTFVNKGAQNQQWTAQTPISGNQFGHYQSIAPHNPAHSSTPPVATGLLAELTQSPVTPYYPLPPQRTPITIPAPGATQNGAIYRSTAAFNPVAVASPLNAARLSSNVSKARKLGEESIHAMSPFGYAEPQASHGRAVGVQPTAGPSRLSFSEFGVVPDAWDAASPTLSCPPPSPTTSASYDTDASSGSQGNSSARQRYSGNFVNARTQKPRASGSSRKAGKAQAGSAAPGPLQDGAYSTISFAAGGTETSGSYNRAFTKRSIELGLQDLEANPNDGPLPEVNIGQLESSFKKIGVDVSEEHFSRFKLIGQEPENQQDAERKFADATEILFAAEDKPGVSLVALSEQKITIKDADDRLFTNTKLMQITFKITFPGLRFPPKKLDIWNSKRAGYCTRGNLAFQIAAMITEFWAQMAARQRPKNYQAPPGWDYKDIGIGRLYLFGIHRAKEGHWCATIGVL